ncbi:coatomer subunit beta, putative [Entamoeba invadens IP1]|uniref:coatomer subunit beta, putative n=1 Tax=Entamoeba invadens IP1 TaxID=370355 RepID=UPI0002C3F202|nr:coatomer subunit beta, putative [Entamoeba invadens IP1]ELP85042.1 coatomer subunit beta, putative [Entamoeba invadens IP1]|eukprot:XP_004184388.1 coatomer subunit beta, putative [Entamoeba invadens IP1]
MSQTYQLFNNYLSYKAEDVENMLKKDDSSRKEALQQIISEELNNNSHPEVMMNVIRYALPSTDHEVKRLFLFYLSTVQRVDEAGKLLPELILAINSLLQDLNHPNEYVRALTLKFILTVREKEFLQPLAHAVVDNVDSQSTLVRRHCYTAIAHIFKAFPDVVPNAPELLKTALIKERNGPLKCSALRALIKVDLATAVAYVVKKAEQINTSEESLQLEILNLIKAVSKSTPQHYSTYLTICSALITSQSPAVSYEAATCLLSVSSSPSAVKAGIKCMIDIVIQSSDMNVKMSVLNRISQQIMKTPRLMCELEIDLLRGFQNTSSYVRSTFVGVVVQCVTAKSVNEVINALKKELLKEENEEYQLVVVQAIKLCNKKFQSESIVPVLLDIMRSTKSLLVSKEILLFLKAMLNIRNTNNKEILKSMFEIIQTETSPILLSEFAALLARFCQTPEELKEGFDKVNSIFSPLTGVSLLTNTNTIIIGLFVSSLVKLVLKGEKVLSKPEINQIRARALKSLLTLKKVETNSDVIGKIRQGMTCLTTKDDKLKEIVLLEPLIEEDKIVQKTKSVQVDDEIVIGIYNENTDNMPMPEKEEKSYDTFRNIVQLSGYSDILYLEASMELSQFDINIDTLIVNQSQSTLENIVVQLVPRSEGLSVVGQFAPLTLGPGEFTRVTIPVKVTGTSSGLIAGYVNFDKTGKEVTTGSSDGHMVLSNISVEALDSINPGNITNEEFQTKWAEYEWENKIVVETEINNLSEFIENICKEARMNCITPKNLFCSEIGFLSANLYATTVFGDDALANISVEIDNGKITGGIRIRAKSQGVAVSLGDRILLVQKKKVQE